MTYTNVYFNWRHTFPRRQIELTVTQFSIPLLYTLLWPLTHLLSFLKVPKGLHLIHHPTRMLSEQVACTYVHHLQYTHKIITLLNLQYSQLFKTSKVQRTRETWLSADHWSVSRKTQRWSANSSAITITENTHSIFRFRFSHEWADVNFLNPFVKRLRHSNGSVLTLFSQINLIKICTVFHS